MYCDFSVSAAELFALNKYRQVRKENKINQLIPYLGYTLV